MFIQSRDASDNVTIISAISSDGYRWTPEPGIRIRHGTTSEMDSEAGEPEAVLGVDGKYYMAYQGRQPIVPKPSIGETLYHKILFAVSDDGLSWRKLNVSFSDPTRINAFAGSADIIIVNGTYVMYYTGSVGIYKATSNDAVNWVRQGPVYDNLGHDSGTVYVNGTYYMFIKAPSNFGPTISEDDETFMAISRDGVNWPNRFYRVVAKSENGSDVSRTLEDPTAAVLSDGSLRVYLNTRKGLSIVAMRPLSSLPRVGALGDTVTTVFTNSSYTLGFMVTGNIFDDSAMGFIYSHRSPPKTIFLKTDTSRVLSTGRPTWSGYAHLITVGGRAANPTTKYYEDNGLAPLKAVVNTNGTLSIMHGSTVALNVPLASITSANDYFVMQVVSDGMHKCIILWGIDAKGTYASGIYFDGVFPTVAGGCFW